MKTIINSPDVICDSLPASGKRKQNYNLFKFFKKGGTSFLRNIFAMKLKTTTQLFNLYKAVKLFFVFILIICSDFKGFSQTTLINQQFSAVAPSGWSATASWNLVYSNLGDGYGADNYYAYYSALTDNNNKYIYIPLSVTSGKIYNISFYTRSAISTTINFNETADQNTILFSGNSNPGGQTSTWNLSSLIFLSNYTGNGYVQILINSVTSGTANVKLDNVIITETTPTNYYSKSSGNLNDRLNWGTNTDGSGSNPTNFTTANQVFNIRNNASPTIGASWTVSGTNTAILVGDGTNACNFTVPSTFVVTAPITNVNNNATITRTSSGVQSFGSMTVLDGGTYDHNYATGSLPTATWNATSTLLVSADLQSNNFAGVTFGNVTFRNTAGTTMFTSTLANGAATIAGNLTLSGTGTVVVSNQASFGATLSVTGNLNISGNSILRLENVTTASATVTKKIVVTGNYSQSTGTLDLATNTSSSITANTRYAILEVKGHFTHTGGTISETATDVDMITRVLLSKTSGTQTLESTGQTGLIDFNVAASNAQCVISATKTFILSSTATMTIANGTSAPDLLVDGTFRNSAAPTVTGTITFSSTGTYEHNFTTTAGTIPTATWNTTSTCYIMGYTTGGGNAFQPLNLGQSFGNFTWNTPALSSTNANLGGNLTTINGNFTVENTNSKELRLGTGQSYTLAVGGDLILNTSTAFLTVNYQNAAGAMTAIINVAGNFTQVGGTLRLAHTSNVSVNYIGTATINVTKNVSLAGTVILSTSNGAGTINQNGAAPTYGFSQTAGSIDFGQSTGTAGAGAINIKGTYSLTGTGAITTSGTAAPNGLITFNGGSSQTITNSTSGLLEWVDWNVANGSTTALSSNHAINTANTSIFTVANGGTLDFSTYVLSGAATSTFVAATGSTLISANTTTAANGGAIQTSTAFGSVQTTTRTFSAAGVSYTFNGASVATGNAIASATNTNIKNLTINSSSNVALTSSAVLSATGVLTFTSGSLDIGANDLTLTSGATVSGAGTGKYVKTSGAGQLKRTALTTAFTFPVGNSAYNPIILTNTGTSDTYGVIAKDGTVPNATDATLCVNRYWAVTEGTTGGGNLAVTAQFNTADGAGASYSTATNPQYIGLYPNATPWTQVSSGAAASGSNPYTVSASGFTTSLPTSGSTYYFAVGNYGAFTSNTPSITVSTTSLTGFTACPNTASSTATFTVSGSNLGSNNLVVTAPAGFELLQSGGASYASTYTLTPTSGTVGSTTMTVRMSAQASSPTSANITCASSGATTKNVAVSGTVYTAISGNTSGSAVSICSGATTTLTGGTVTGGNSSYTYLWESSSNNSTWATATGTSTGANYTTAALSSATYYRRTVTSGSCSDVAASILVSINALPTAVTVSTAGTYCTSTTLTAANGGDGTIYWQNTTTSGTSTASASTSQLVSASTTYYFRAQSSAGCWGTQGSAAVTINLVPVVTTPPNNSSIVTAANTTFTVAASNTPTSYSWEVNTGSGWAAVTNVTPYSGATSATLTITAAPFSMNGYQYRATATNACGSAVSTLATLTVTYCLPAPTSVDGTGITNVSFSTVNNTTAAETNNYGNYSAQIGTAVQGATLPVNITFSTGYTYGTKIWVDWDDNGTFVDATELMYTGISLATNPTTLAASFTVPSSAVIGNHRMRIGGTDTDTGPTTACYTSTYGSFEDYTINITAPVALSAAVVTAGTVQTICSTGSGTLLTATGTNGGSLTYVWGKRSATGGTITPISAATSSTYTPTGSGLGSGTWYVVCTITPTVGSAIVSNEITVTVNTTPTLSYAGSPLTYTQNSLISALTPTTTATSFSVSPALPTGLSLSTTTGEISGTPSVYQVSTSYTITGTGTNGCATTANIYIGVSLANDLCSGAIELTAGATAVSGTTLGATIGSLGACTGGSGDVDKDVWYKFTPSCTGNYTLSVAGSSNFNTIIQAYSNCSATLVNNSLGSSCTNVTGNGQIESPTYSLTSSSTYYFRVYDKNGAGLTDFTIAMGSPVVSSPTNLTGTLDVCPSNTYSYSVDNVPGNTYTWTLPSGWSGSSTSNTISATTSSTAGNVSVTATNACGTSAAASVSVNVKIGPSGLSAGTSSSICAGNSVSLTGVATVPSSGVTTVLNEGFNSALTSSTWTGTLYASLLDGWYDSYSNASGGNTWSGNGYAGNCAYYYTYLNGDGTSADLISPSMDLSSYTSATLTFWIYNSNGTDVLNVYASNAGGAYTQIGSTNYAIYSSWTQITIPLTGFVGAGKTAVTIKLRGTSDFGYSNIGIDELQVEGTSISTPVYAWTSSPVGYTSSSLSPGSITPSATTLYTLSVSSNGCTATNSITVTVNNPSVAPSSLSASTATICNGSSTTLTQTGGSLGTGASWQWYSDANFTTAVGSTLSASNASLSVSPTASTTYYLRAINGTSPCGASIPASTPSTVSVTVTVDPTTVAGTVAGGTTICSGSTSALLTLSGHTGTVTKWQSSVSPFSTWTDIVNTATTYTSGALTATTQFRAVVQSGSCASANSAVTTVTVDPTTVAGTVAGGTTICSGSTSALLTLSGHTGAVSKWQSSVSPFSTWTDIVNTATTYTSGALTATTQFRAVVQSGSCAAANSVVTTVTVDPTTVAGTVAGGTTICSGSTSAVLTLSGHTGTVTKWQSSVSPFSTWTDIVNTATTYTSGALTATTQFRAVVQSGSCAAANSVVTTVTVDPTTVAGTVSAGTTPQCIGLTATYSVSGTVLGGGTGAWSSDNTSVATVNASTGVVTAVAAGTCNIVYTVTGGCGGTKTASASFTVTPTAVAGTLSAGTTPQCIGLTATYSVSGTVFGGGTGAWSSSNTAVATVASTGIVTAVGNGTCNIVYTVTGGCGGTVASSASFTVTTPSTGTMTSYAGDYVWSGLQSGDFGTIANWYQYTTTGYTVAPSAPNSTIGILIPAAGTCVVNQPTISSGTVSLDSLTILSGATLTVGSAATVNVGDNFTNNGTLVADAASTFNFTGSTNQSIAGSSSSTFGNVTINKSSISNSVTMATDATTLGTLTLTSGKLIVAGGKTLSIGNTSANGIITGGSSSSYIVAYDNGTTIGKLQRAINTAASTTYVFPIGDLSSYTPVNYTLTTGTLSNANVSVYTKPIRIPSMNISLQTYLNRYWEVTPTGISGSTYNISYNYANGDINSGGTAANLRPVKLSGGVWYRPIGSAFQTGVTEGTGSVDIANNLLTWSGLTTYSAFGGAGNEAVVLPVDLVLFTGACVDRKNILKWESFTEMNNDYYTIENTTDGISFEEIGIVDGAGNSSEINAYEMVHENYRNAINYYRLKQTDFDGSSKYSELISIDNRSGLNEKEIVSITNLLGQEINENYKGLVIVTFTDGSSVKRIQ